MSKDKDKVKRPETVHNVDLLKALVNRSTVEWIVIHTNPKCEKRAHDGLMAMGILAYLPMEYIERVHGANTKKKQGQTYSFKRPMFTRYLFAGIDASLGQCVDDVRSCDGVEGVVCFTENGSATRVNKAELSAVIDVSHGTFEDEPVPDDYFAWIADLPQGHKLALVKGAWQGIDFTLTAYDKARKRVEGVLDCKSGEVPLTVPVDAVKLREVPTLQDDSSDPSGTGESIHHTNGATEAANPAN